LSLVLGTHRCFETGYLTYNVYEWLRHKTCIKTKRNPVYSTQN